MKGRNELHINQSTMIEAMQVWVNKAFASLQPVVTSVKKDDKKSLGVSECFIIELDDKIGGEECSELYKEGEPYISEPGTWSK